MDMYLIVQELKDAVLLKVRVRVLGMDVERQETYITDRVETFRFDVKHRIATFTIRYANRKKKILYQQEIQQFTDILKLAEVSMLRYIHSENLLFHTYILRPSGENAYKDKLRRKGVYAILRMLRDAFQRKWKDVYGYTVSSPYVPAGTGLGMMLFPLFNLAWRLRYPDTANLPKELANSRKYEVDSYLQQRLIGPEQLAQYAGKMDANDRRRSSAQTLIARFHLPDVPFVRRIVTSDALAAPELQQAFRVTQNPNYIPRLLQAMSWTLDTDGYGMFGFRFGRARSYNALYMLAQYWDMPRILAYLKRGPSLHELLDIVRMLVMLPEEERMQLEQHKLAWVHDWLVERTKTLKQQGFILHVPEAVRKRLQMQVDNGYLKCFLPENSKELDHASDVLHNCVRTYSEDVALGNCQIVLMTDSKGLLTACLEVRGKALVQAKLKYNRCVYKDDTVNAAVLEWAEKAGLTIQTKDVQKPIKTIAQEVV